MVAWDVVVSKTFSEALKNRKIPVTTREKTMGYPVWDPLVPSITVETQGTATLLGRVRLQWQPNAISSRWLQIQVLATTNTRLPNRALYSVGHLQSESGLNPPAPNGLLLVQAPGLTATVPAFGAAGSLTNRLDINKNGLITTADLRLVRAIIAAGRFLRLITIAAAGSNEEGALGLGGGNGGGGGGGDGGNGDGVGGSNDNSLLDGFAMMAPPVDLASKSENLVSLVRNEPEVIGSAILQPAGANSFPVTGSLKPQGSRLTLDREAEETSRQKSLSGTQDVMFTDDFFVRFEDRDLS